jgi:FkbM family methyltransferase
MNTPCKAMLRGADAASVAAIAFYGLFRHRPGVWRLMARWGFPGDWCLRLKTRRGVARLVFDPRQTDELTVVDELLYEPLYQTPCDCEVFVDCGAFRGISTVYLQDQVRADATIAIEPQQQNFERLSRRLQVHLPAVKAVNAALGVTSGEVFFAGEGVGGRISEEGIRTRVVGLDDLPELGKAQCLLLKMDVEGAEKDLLPALLPLLPKKCVILLETHYPEHEARQMLRVYEDSGFSVVLLRKRADFEAGVDFIDWELCRGIHDGAHGGAVGDRR